MPNTDDDKHLAEWKAARDVLNRFDERLHDLRKYGFTFVTALLAAESILVRDHDKYAQRFRPFFPLV